MSSKPTKKILIAALDWGLGHTTRCLPLIRHLRRLGHQVVFAGNQWQGQFVAESEPGVDNLSLPGYEVRYNKRGALLVPGLLLQLPGLIRKIGEEHLWLDQVVKDHGINAVISDNRYGLYHESIPCVIMTHQLQVATGAGRLADELVRKIHYKFLGRFREVWVPDVAKSINLSGKLGHPPVIPEETRYLGLLTHLQKSSNVSMTKPEPTLLILLSGPEPQRSILSEKLWTQLSGYRGKVCFVEGSPSVSPRQHIPGNVDYHLQLTGELLGRHLETAALVICRSGYSTLMDLIAFNRKAYLIPTPGQTEQEYLAKHLFESGIFPWSDQTHFTLEKALLEAETFAYRSFPADKAFELHEPVLEHWLAGIP